STTEISTLSLHDALPIYWHDGVRHLQRRGVQVAVVGLDAASFENSPADEDTLALLEGANIPVLRVKCEESIAEALEKDPQARFRSEEHTSELQSLAYLVC